MTECESEPNAQSFETSLAELQGIVSRLEDGSISLEESMRQFERGVGLLKNCYQVLDHAEQRIELLTGVDRAGQPQTRPFDGSATFDASKEEGSSRKTKPRRGDELPF